MGLINLDIKQILLLLGSIGGFIGWLIVRAKYRQQGRQEIINKNFQINVAKILDFNKKSEALKGREYELKNCIPNDNATLERLSKESGITTISGIADAGLCQEVPGSTGSHKTPDATRKD